MVGFISLLALVVAPPDDLARWEPEIVKLEAKLKDQPLPSEAILFVGSSSIRLWNTAKAFPDRSTVNVGFGGSEIRHSTAFAERIILPVKPKAIVFYAGDNDIAKKRTPQQVAEDLQAFVAKVHQSLPQCQILFIAIKPSPSRWALFDQQREANRLIQGLCEKNPQLRFIDVVPSMLGPDGKPIPEHFVKDQLHLSEQGYQNWQKLVAAELAKLK